MLSRMRKQQWTLNPIVVRCGDEGPVISAVEEKSLAGGSFTRIWWKIRAGEIQAGGDWRGRYAFGQSRERQRREASGCLLSEVLFLSD